MLKNQLHIQFNHTILLFQKMDLNVTIVSVLLPTKKVNIFLTIYAH